MADTKRTDGAVVMPGPDVAKPDTPIPTDGWRSRKLIIGTSFAVLLFLVASALLVWSGRYTDGAQWFTQTYWLYASIGSICLIGLTLGLLTVGTLLEMVKIVIPILRGGGR